MVIGEVQHIELKVCILDRLSTDNGTFWLHDVITLQHKVSYTLVHPIITHILWENKEFLHSF